MDSSQAEKLDLEQVLSGLATADGLFAVGLDQRITCWSDSACRILGHSRQEAIGRPCYELVGGRDAGNFLFCRRNCPTIANAKRHRTTPDYDICALTRAGDPVWINVTIMLLRGEQEPTPWIVHLFRDVTARRQVEQAAARTMRTLRNLLTDSAAGSGDRHQPELAPTPLPSLTKRELDVLRLLACGSSTSDIARDLYISRATARNHIARLLAKLGAKSRLQAVAFASSRNLI